MIFFILFQASLQGHREVVSLLINNERCDINEKEEDDQTALHLSIFNANIVYL